MTRTLIPLALALALAACGSKDDRTVVSGVKDDLTPEQQAAATKIELPPAILASKSYRCKDNSLLFVDWLDNGGAKVRKTKEGEATKLEPGNTDLVGTKDEASISYQGLACKA